MTGNIDYARSSGGPGNTSCTQFTFIPFARDAVSFATYQQSTGVGNPATVTTISQADLTSIFTVGPEVVGSTVIVGCDIQAGSGTRSFWNGISGFSASATSLCDNAGVAGGIQENDGPALAAKGAAVAALSNTLCDGDPAGPAVPCTNVEVIVGFSAGAYIAKTNGVASPNPTAKVKLGTIQGLPAPTAGSGTSLTPNSAFYGSTTYGRYVYNVLATENIQDAGQTDIQNMFVGPTSAICSAAADVTTAKFGFQPLPVAPLTTECGGGHQPASRSRVSVSVVSPHVPQFDLLERIQFHA